VTRPGSSETITPAGTSMGLFPILLMIFLAICAANCVCHQT
jgi:hypothetical protein